MNKTFCFMGTGPFALEALTGLWENLHADDRLVVYTKEAKRAGRGMKEKDGCVAAFAREKGLPLYQPHSLKEEDAKEEFLSLKADLVVVASYGLLLPPYVIHAPKYGCINLHASLLPKYRGAAPIQRAILDGEDKTGVTVMQMDEGLDTGDMLLKRELLIEENESCGELSQRLAMLGKEMLLEILPDIFANKLTPIPQDHTQSTYASKIQREDQDLNFEEETEKILNRIRALSPAPGALCRKKETGSLFKIYSAEKAEGEFSGMPGEVIGTKGKVLVKTGDGAIVLLRIQPEGKGQMNAMDAVNGRKIALGDLFQ